MSKKMKKYTVGILMASTIFGVIGAKAETTDAAAQAWGGQWGSYQTYGHMYDSGSRHYSYTKRTSGGQRTSYAAAGQTSYSNSYGGSHQYWGFGR